jgi:MarR family transcriptional regulator, 2-MHQ and catechol-resistance regulon repressor
MLVQAALFATLLDIKHLYIKMVRQRRDRPDISGVHLWLVLWKANHALERHSSRSVEAAGMCRSDFGVLEALLHKGPLPVTVLGAKVLLTSGSITTAVDRLERRGLVERSGEASDRRTRLVRLTGAGRKLIRKLFAEHEQAMEKAVSALAPAERAALIGLLRKLGRGAEEILSNSPRGRSAQ